MLAHRTIEECQDCGALMVDRMLVGTPAVWAAYCMAAKRANGDGPCCEWWPMEIQPIEPDTPAPTTSNGEGSS